MNKYGEPWMIQDDSILDYKRFDFATLQAAQEVEDRINECVNACAGIENPGEAIREAREALGRYALDGDGAYGQAGEADTRDLAIIALTKLQPKQAE